MPLSDPNAHEKIKKVHGEKGFSFPRFLEKHLPFLLKLNRFVTLHLVLILAMTLLATWVISRNMMAGASEHMAANELLEEADDGMRAIHTELSVLEKVAIDYARWDEAYEALRQKNIPWIKSNCTEWLIKNFDMSAVGVFDTHGQLIESPNPEILRKVPQNLILASGKKFTNNAGLVQIDDQIFFLAYVSVVDSLNTRTPAGTLVLLKSLDVSLLSDLNQRYKVCMALATPRGIVTCDELGKILTPEMGAMITNALMAANPSEHHLSPTLYARSFSVKSLFSNQQIPLLVVRNISDRVTIMSYLSHAILMLGIGITLVMAVAFYFINRYITHPIEQFSRKLQSMSDSGTFETVSIRSRISEISTLLSAFNSLSDSLKQTQWENSALMRERHRDPLTGLFNHGFFHNYLDKSLDAFDQLHILFLDIDNFKLVNDTHGHKKGDQVLEEVASILKSVIGSKGMAIRYGGEEFLAVLTNSQTENAILIGDAIRNRISSSHKIQSCRVSAPITVSIGIATYPSHATTLDEVVRLADMAMYYSKSTGKNRTIYYDDRIEVFMASMNTDLLRMNMAYIRALAEAIDSKIGIKPGHSQKVMDYSLVIAEMLNFSKEELDDLRISALLHDCGKISIPDQLFMKKENLTDEEYHILMGHAALGYEIMAKATQRKGILDGIRHHHERFDGNGYPDGLRGHDIPLNGRIICIANALHTMQCDLPYKSSLSPERIKSELLESAGILFDPEIVHIAIERLLLDAHIR